MYVLLPLSYVYAIYIVVLMLGASYIVLGLIWDHKDG